MKAMIATNNTVIKTENAVECDTNCIDCKSYYRCSSPMKLDENSRDFWLKEREQDEEKNYDCE